MMNNRSISQWVAFGAILFAGLQEPEFATAQRQCDRTEAPSSAEDGSQKLKREALAWLDAYRSVQVVFDEEHIKEVRAKVAQMSPEELQRWLVQTAEVRALLESDDWREIREWLREFLRVQAIYSDEDIERFREKAARASPSKLRTILMDIKRMRDTEQWMHAASESGRQASLAMWEKYEQQATALRAVPRKAASFGTRPSFSSGQSALGRQFRKSRYGVPPPLVTSRGVARRAVWGSMFGGWGWGW